MIIQVLFPEDTKYKQFDFPIWHLKKNKPNVNPGISWPVQYLINHAELMSINEFKIELNTELSVDDVVEGLN